MGKHCSKAKIMQGKHYSNQYIFLKNTKLNSQPTQYKKNKIYKDHFVKKKENNV